MKREIVTPRKKVAFKALGGRSRAVAWHFGVLKGLLERGFTILSGPAENRPKEIDGSTISVFIGSSAGAFFSTLVSCGYDGLDMLRAIDPRTPDAVLRLPRFSARTIFKRHRHSLREYLRRIKNDVRFREGLNKFPPSDSGWGGKLKTLYMLTKGINTQDLAFIRKFTTTKLEKFLHESVTWAPADQFELLAPKLYILATDDDDPCTTVFGTRDSELQGNYKYMSGIPISKACVASMAVPGLFEPVMWNNHHYMDGDIRVPFFTNVAEDENADLIFVSSVYFPHRVLPNSKNPYDRVTLTELGLRPMISQVVSHAMQGIRITAELEQQQYVDAFVLLEKKMHQVREQLKERGLSDKEIEALGFEEIREDLKKALKANPDTKVIYIELPVTEQNLFFSDPFDLSPRVMGEIFVKGYRESTKILKRYDFQ